MHCVPTSASIAMGVISTAALLRGLTEAQRTAATHVEGPLLILAGPGSGKTRVVTHRIAYLIAQGIPGSQILALTFTNKAAEEMRSRLDSLVPGHGVWAGTFHRFCARVLRRHAALVGLEDHYSILDAEDSRKVLKRTIEELGQELIHFTPERVAATISWAKNNVIRPEEYNAARGGPLGRIVERVYPAYQRVLRSSNAVDFDDLLLHVAVLLREYPEVRSTLDARFRYILVDEYQDTNRAQYVIVRGLSIDHPHVAVTGDPDQSIYGWRGANIQNILDFEHDFQGVKVVRLEQNYRSTKNILRVADALIAHNQMRKRKRMFTDNPAGKEVSLVKYTNQMDEADAIARRIAGEIACGRRRPRDFAIFYRMNALSRTLEGALRDQGIPYQIVRGVEFFQRREIKDVLAYLLLINNPRNDEAFLRIVNAPPRGIGKISLERLTQHARGIRSPLWEAARSAPSIAGLGKKPASALVGLSAMLDLLAASAGAPVEEILGQVLELSGYSRWLRESGDEEDLERLENVQELLTSARQFDERHPDEDRLSGFLENASLVSDTDSWDGEDDRVTLMTLHASKGLEFPVVFMVALEEGILPHERSREVQEQLEEERRLTFVGMTRAKEELELSMAMYRDFRGRRQYSVPSQFLLELPISEMRVVEPCGYTGDDDPGFAEQRESFAIEEASTHAAAAGEESFTDSHRPNRRRRDRPTRGGSLPTAADLAAGTSENLERGYSPEQFCQGMVVSHPDYGLGKIVSVSGTGANRRASVAFASQPGEKKFILSKSPLRPVRVASKSD